MFLILFKLFHVDGGQCILTSIALIEYNQMHVKIFAIDIMQTHVLLYLESIILHLEDKLFFNSFDGFCRHPSDNRVWSNILCNHSSRGNNGAFTYPHSRQDGDI